MNRSARPVPLPALLPRRRPWAAAFGAAIAVALALAASPPSARAAEPGAAGTPALPTEPDRWPAEAIDLLRVVPIQNQGRVKPLDTYAGYTLLQANHKRSVKDPYGRTLDRMEWLLDALLRPDVAKKTEAFSIETSEVLDAIGLAHEGKKKRDRYSYEQLAPGLPRLRAKAREFAEIPSKDRDPIQTGVVDLAHSLFEFESLLLTMDFARRPLPLPDVPEVRALFPDRSTVTAWEALGQAEAIRRLAGAANPHGDDGAEAEAGADGPRAAARRLRSQVIGLCEAAASLAIVAPLGPREEEAEWHTPGHLLYARLSGAPLSPEQQALLAAFAGLATSAGDANALVTEARALHDASVGLAKGRGEYGKIPLEVRLSRMDPFYRSLYLYLTAFLLIAVGWVWPNRWLRRGAWALMLAGLALHVTGIVIRCILRERPPITTLYETALFIAATAVIACLAAEWITRRGIGLALSPIIGGLTLFVANKFELLKGEDTMPQLVAVLDTNFWLATHVTFITLGYMGGLLAAAVAHVTIFGRILGIQRGKEDFYRTIHRITYGMLAFGLVFSVIGTILGGIWANESWGRFWGWDPKENGALMICLAQLAILHGRVGGYLKPHGLAIATVAQGCVVAFSWWGVNLLGIGLHSYGFTGGVWTGLLVFYASQGVVMGIGLLGWALGRAYPKPAGRAPVA